MASIQKTVFLSYRRVDIPWALAIHHALSDRGFDVFLDIRSLRSGAFAQVIQENIRARAHFLLLLTPQALNRCTEPGDWLIHELELALEARRNIVPVLLEGFQFSDPQVHLLLSGSLRQLARYNALSVPADYFDEAVERLCSSVLSVPLDAVLHPMTELGQHATEVAFESAARQPNADLTELAARETAQVWMRRAAETHTADLAQQLRCLDQAVQAAPHFVAARAARAIWRIYFADDAAGALDDLNAAVEQQPYDPALLSQRAVAHQKLKDMAAALRDYDAALELDPLLTRTRVFRADLRESRGDMLGALADYDAVLANKPDDALALVYRGRARLTQGDLEGALADLNRRLALAPDDLYGLYMRRDVHRKRGDAPAAARDQARVDALEEGGGTLSDQ